MNKMCGRFGFGLMVEDALSVLVVLLAGQADTKSSSSNNSGAHGRDLFICPMAQGTTSVVFTEME